MWVCGVGKCAYSPKTLNQNSTTKPNQTKTNKKRTATESAILMKGLSADCEIRDCNRSEQKKKNDLYLMNAVKLYSSLHRRLYAFVGAEFFFFFFCILF